MTPAVLGAALGAVLAVGALLTVSRVAAIRRTSLSVRVLPYIQHVPRPGQRSTQTPVDVTAAGAVSPGAAARAIVAPLLDRAGATVGRVLGGSASVRRRLDRAGLDVDVQEFRVSQVLWGLGGFAAAATWQVLTALSGGGSLLSGVVLCLCGFVVGVVLCDRRLTQRAVEREREVLVEFPVVAELLALAVASGEGPVAALDRAVRRSSGAWADELGRVLAQVRTGVPVAAAFESLGERTDVPAVTQFARGVAVSVDRGTPLADVLHAQAADVREAGKRALIESAARREVFMLAPVVFLVLPVTVIFALYPGLVGLRLVAP